MNRIPNSAEDVTHIPPASHKNTAFAESPIAKESTTDGGGEEIHSFSRTLAREMQTKKGERAGHAAHEATVLKYLAHRVRASKNVVDGKQWFYTTLEYLHTIFPYLSKSALAGVVHRLDSLEYCTIGNFNRYKYDYTFWYHVPENVRNAAEEDLIYFSADATTQFGVPGAVILRNFEYHANGEKRVRMSPAALAEHLPFSVDTIKRGLKALEGKHIRKVSLTTPMYEKMDLGIGANLDGVGANLDRLGADVDGLGANLDDDTYYKSVSKPLETHSKEDAALPSFEFPSDGEENICSSNYPLHHGITPDADGQGGALMFHEEERRPTTVSLNDDMAGAASHVPIEWPQIEDYDHLHTLNSINSAYIFGLQGERALKDEFNATVDEVCHLVLAQLDETMLDYLYHECEADELMATLKPLLDAVFPSERLETHGALFDCIYYGSLECLVGAFVWSEERWYPHPMTALVSITHDIYLEVWDFMEERSRKMVEEEFAQRRKDFASVDEHKEHDPHAASAEKMRVFRNGLNARNQVGWIFYDQQHRTDCITGISARSLNLIKNLFAHNPQLTPADLLSIMDRVMAAYIGQPKPMEPQPWKGWFPPKGIQWHARRGHNLLFFITNLHTIVKQLNMTTPIEKFLHDLKTAEEKPEMQMEAMAA